MTVRRIKITSDCRGRYAESARRRPADVDFWPAGRGRLPILDAIPARLLEQLAAYDWTGHVRELGNVLERDHRHPPTRHCVY